ncbi:MAG: hypothetical protein JJU11_03985 [Candidatus Sumerlaeia bacterium]|nr:hypothetical protein [Candidatus Sumerlaeia bacterium]
MSYEYSYAQICAQVNAALDVRRVVEYIGWETEKLVRSGDIYLGMCPIHHEKMFRTLELNPRNNTYECKHVNCPGNAPSDLLDLIVKSSRKSLPEVLLNLANHFGPDQFRLTDRQMEFLADLVNQVREYENAQDASPDTQAS